MEFFERFKKQFSAFYGAVDPGTKLLAFLILFVLIAAVSVAVFLNRQPDYSLLFSNLSEATAADVVRVLDDNGFQYELKNGGRNVYVDKAVANKVKLILKAKGLPKDGDRVGFEIFDKTNLGVTDFVQTIQHHRALAGELERTIGAIKGVDSVRVHIVLPEEKLFEKEKQEPTATILLTLTHEGALDSNQIDGIRQLTASSVEGLKPKSITIVDNFGNVLAASQDGDEGVGLMTSRMTVQRSVEAYYIKKVQTLLDSVLGAGNSVVRVDAMLDFNKIEETEEKFDPESAVVRQETITTEKTAGSTSSSKGAPGVQSNMTPGVKNSGSGNSQENQTSREVLNNKYEIDKKITHVIRSVGDIKKLSISVFLKQKSKLDKDGKPVIGEDGKIQFDPRPADELKSYNDIVNNAIGFDDKRGDKVVIKEVPFDKRVDLSEYAPKQFSSGDVNSLIAPAIKFMVLGGLVLFFSRNVMRKGGGDSLQAPRKSSGASSGEEPPQMESPAVGSDLLALREKGLKAVEKGAFVESEITKLVDNFPSETEVVLKKWLKE